MGGLCCGTSDQLFKEAFEYIASSSVRQEHYVRPIIGGTNADSKDTIQLQLHVIAVNYALEIANARVAHAAELAENDELGEFVAPPHKACCQRARRQAQEI